MFRGNTGKRARHHISAIVPGPICLLWSSQVPFRLGPFEGTLAIDMIFLCFFRERPAQPSNTLLLATLDLCDLPRAIIVKLLFFLIFLFFLEKLKEEKEERKKRNRREHFLNQEMLNRGEKMGDVLISFFRNKKSKKIRKLGTKHFR